MTPDFFKDMRMRELVMDSTPSLISYVDRDYFCRYANRAFRDWFGLKEDEVVGKHMEDVLGTDLFRRTRELMGRALNGGPVECELEIPFSANGTQALGTKFIPHVAENEQVKGFVFCADSSASRRKPERALIESESGFCDLANSIPQLAWMTDEEGSIVWYNQRWYDYTGASFEDMKGWGWTSVHHPDHVDRVVDLIKRHFQSGESWEDTFPLRGKNGEYRWFLSRANPVRDESGRIVRWFGSNTDITEQREAAERLKATEAELRDAMEKAQSANAAKSEFLANISHEIRTPMNSILGFSELLQDPGLDPRERLDFVQRIRRSGHRLLRLIDDILDLSKFDAGKMPIDKERFAAIELIFEVMQSFSPLAEKKEIALNVRFITPIPEIIESDPLRLRQILDNLIGNALKFTESGGRVDVHLAFEPTRSPPESGMLQIEIEDTGIGISMEDQRKLFQSFCQADGSIVRKFGGSGLGLVLSQRLARALGGEVVLKSSALGHGSRFQVSIATGPIGRTEFVTEFRPSPLPDQNEAPRQPQNLPRLYNARVLLAEDSPDNEMLIRIYMDGEGARLDVAHNGQEAIEMAKTGSYDVVLMDIQMPVLDGLEATRRLRAQGFQQPIVALTAHALGEEIEKSLRAGCDAHLTKPVNRQELIESILEQIRPLVLH